jgi:hypothetical protein
MELKHRAVLARTLHRELALRDDFTASDTAFSIARSARDPLEAAARQNTAFESPSNQKAQRLWVRHWAVS